ncbi:MAG: SHOCT domain-containing protein [Dehalococcoidia bacterium]|nr:SHOCT domain-containing protein [Dehalococcoidia bacterium]
MEGECAYHPNRKATGGCIRCQKLICEECKVVIRDEVFCPTCAEAVRAIDKSQPPSEADRIIMTRHAINILRDGKINLKFQGIASPVTPQINEEIKFVLPNITLLESRSVRTGTAIYGGPTFRVTKGVSFRLGGVSGSSASHEELRTIDNGILTLTNQRIVFSGSLRTVSIQLGKIITVEPYSSLSYEGLSIQRDNYSKMQYFTYSKGHLDEIHLEFISEGEKFNPLLSPQLLESIVEGLIAQNKQLFVKKQAKKDDSGKEILEQIKKLGDLKDRGIITSQEFELKKAEMLKRL